MVEGNRRRCLTALGAIGASALAGCLGGAPEVRGEFEIDRSALETDEECAEVELANDDFVMVPKALSGVVGSSTSEWRIDMREDESLEVAVYKREPRADYGMPGLAIDAPDGSPIVEKKRISTNIRTVPAGTDGTYTVRVLNPYYTEGHGYRVILTWYASTGCTASS